MNNLKQRSLPSLRLLLYLEWILLGVSLFTTVLKPMVLLNCHDAIAVNLLRIVAFGLMGLRLPTERLRYKIVYTVVELGIILLPVMLNDQVSFDLMLSLVAVIRACQMFGLIGRLVVTGVVFVSFLYALLSHNLPAFSISYYFYERIGGFEQIKSHLSILRISTAFAFAISLSFVLLLVNALLAERRSRQELVIAHEKLRHYALRIENQAALQERNRIAREIHDSLGHTLTAQNIQLENALLFLPTHPEKTKGFLTEAKQLGCQAFQEVAKSVATLRSNPLQGQTLELAIDGLLQTFYTITALTPTCALNLTSPITPEVTTALYRIIQEALTNISRYSGATAVSIQVQSRDGSVFLGIEDDGKGFDLAKTTTGFGIQCMRERAIDLGGTFQIFSTPSQGCRIEVALPLASHYLSRTYDPSVAS